jgi:hypothetical protein
VLLRFLAIEKADRSGDIRQAEAYLSLASAYLMAGDANKASDALTHVRTLDPLSPQLYRLTADIALIEGAFITSDTSLRQDLVQLYQRAMDSKSCALTTGPNGPAINPACGIVHAHVCSASAYTVSTLAASGQRELAETRKTMFIRQFGCPRGPLDAALP